MEINSSSSQEKTGVFTKIRNKLFDCAKKIKKTGKDDPRRIIHAVKVGLALSIVSLFYQFKPLYDGFGAAGMWAVLTVVVVFEFTAGGTPSKCLNRGMATFVAGALGVGAEYLANLGGKKGGPIILVFMVFFLSGAATFTRFIPQVKKRYDYGVLIFILTFSLVAVSGFRAEQIIELAHQRLSTILIGASTCMIISIFVCPVWAGQDLHNLIVGNIENLANFLEGIGSELFNFPEDNEELINGIQEIKEDKPFLQDFKSVLNTKSNEESLANLAWWEPCHGRFRFCHPWKQYLNIGGLIRQCAYHMEALTVYIKPQTQAPTLLQRRVRKPCIEMSLEAGKALKEMASSIKTMTQPSAAIKEHIKNFKSATEELKSILETLSLEKVTNITEIVQIVALTSILIQLTKCVERISEAVHELSDQARFFKKASSDALKSHQLLHRGIVKPVNDGSVDHVVINIGSNRSDDSQVFNGSKNVVPG